ncbi:hypothetical protein QFC21_007377, partial [Naganishia friedmannii]
MATKDSHPVRQPSSRKIAPAAPENAKEKYQRVQDEAERLQDGALAVSTRKTYGGKVQHFRRWMTEYNRQYQESHDKETPNLSDALTVMSDRTATAVFYYITERSMQVRHSTLAIIKAALKEEFMRVWGNAAEQPGWQKNGADEWVGNPCNDIRVIRIMGTVAKEENKDETVVTRQ